MTKQYLDETVQVNERVDDLLDRMTVEEKVGQMVGTTVYQGGEDAVFEAIREHKVGSVSTIGLSYTGASSPKDFAEFVNRAQTVAVEETRLGIPLLTPCDAIHGHANVKGATVFPHNLGMAATRDSELVEEAAGVTAEEMRATGMNHNYNPTADVARDQRWGRTFETFGESPYLCGVMAAAKVRGYQEPPDPVAATAKHFPAYGEPSKGEDTSPVDKSETTVRRSFVPPFAEAVEAGAEAVMPCYNSVDAEPVHGSKRYLTDLLRNELGFDGCVVSDWDGVGMLHEDHRTAASMREAVAKSTEAGLDVASIGAKEHAELLLELVEEGDVSESRIDDSVERVLELKFGLGLFEDPYARAFDEGETDTDSNGVGTEDHRETALRCARRSMTLLKNEGALPLSQDLGTVFVTGPNSDSVTNQCGGWTSREVNGSSGTTVLEGVESVFRGSVIHEEGAGIGEPKDIETARRKSEKADASVVVLGEGAYVHEFIPPDMSHENTGEFPTRTQLSLPSPQQRLLRAVHGTGTPTVLVLVSGRPLAVEWAAENVPAVLMAYYPGSEGGRAVADVVFGSHNPSGSLPVSVPKSTGHLPTRFNHLPHPSVMTEKQHPPSYDPLFGFGHGLSYTEFEYEGIEISDGVVGVDGDVEVNVTLANTGDREGRETLDLYVRDVVSSYVTPVRELAGTETVELRPGERTTVTFELDVEDFGVVYPEGDRVTEPGEFEVSCGGLSESFVVEEE